MEERTVAWNVALTIGEGIAAYSIAIIIQAREKRISSDPFQMSRC